MIDWDNMTPEKAREILSPKRTYTEAEHERAYARYAAHLVEEDLYEIMYEAKKGEKSPAEVVEMLHAILYPPALEDHDRDPDHLHESDDRWFYLRPTFHEKEPGAARKFLKETAESDMHVGDCTAVPASCMRCWVDTFYGVDTQTWKGKGEGSRLLGIANRK